MLERSFESFVDYGCFVYRGMSAFVWASTIVGDTDLWTGNRRCVPLDQQVCTKRIDLWDPPTVLSAWSETNESADKWTLIKTRSLQRFYTYWGWREFLRPLKYVCCVHNYACRWTSSRVMQNRDEQEKEEIGMKECKEREREDGRCCVWGRELSLEWVSVVV